MKARLTYLLFGVLLFSGVLSACVDSLRKVEFKEGVPVEIAIPFGAESAMDITVQTKGGHTIDEESKVWNLYVFIFDSDQNKIYGHFFDETNLGQSTDGSDWWEVVNTSAKRGGTVHLKTLSQQNCTIVGISNIDADMVNISPESLGTVTRLDELKALPAHLNQLVVSRNNSFPMSGEVSGVNIEISGPEDPAGTPYIYKMEGSVKSVVTLQLIRLDAKIKFNIRVRENENNPTIKSRIASFTPMSWQVVNVPKKTHILQENNAQDILTEQDYFSSSSINFDSSVVTGEYYSGSTKNNILLYSFSFYMLENKKAAIGTISTFQDRERQDKSSAHPTDPNDTNPETELHTTVENGAFVHADPYATYVVIKARIGMNNDVAFTEIDDESPDATTLSAEVRYAIHLGDFGENLSDFNILRNNTYTYNINIFDVHDIRVEVERNADNQHGGRTYNMTEDEPSSEGNVVVAMEEIYVCDAHYNTHMISFRSDNISSEDLSWYVETPFHANGAAPIVNNGVEMSTAGIDFEWVLFRRNQKGPADPATGQWRYLETKQQFKPLDYPWESEENPVEEDERTMNVSDLVKYLIRQKNLGAQSDFDSDGKIKVTVFVNEYYYESNPVTGQTDPNLWKSTVNQPFRQMHILSDTRFAADRQSREIGSSFTIQQRSIQTIYNINHPTLKSAWGGEYTDHESEEDAQIDQYAENRTGEKRNNNSMDNGRQNSFVEWELYTVEETDANGKSHKHMYHLTAKSGFWTRGQKARWDDYLNFGTENNTPALKNGLRYLRYTCLSRNRDNDGDEYIDQNELRWYMAATNQMIGLFLGAFGIEGASRLYQRDAQERAGDQWRQHVVSSTRYDAALNSSEASNSAFRVIWAEEGMTGSSYSMSDSYSGITKFSTRCVRNLGFDEEGNDITNADPSVAPENYIKMIRCLGVDADGQPVEYPEGSANPYKHDVYYVFDCTRLNAASRRPYSKSELRLHTENDESSCLYDYFMTASVTAARSYVATDYMATVTDKNGNVVERDVSRMEPMNEYLNQHIGVNPFCPPNYRLPNVRELAVYRYFIPQGDLKPNGDMKIGVFGDKNKNTAFSRTVWSFGYRRENKVDKYTSGKYYYGWAANSDKLLMTQIDGSSQTSPTVRCVRDYKP